MSNYVRIEVQDQFGRWHKFTTVVNNSAPIKFALDSALKSPLAAKSKKARAIEEKTGNLIDMQFG